ncbi:MAG: acyl carrier protein [Clostridia bacterium]
MKKSFIEGELPNMFDQVVELIASQLPVDKAKITLTSRLVEDLGADSANIMILIMDLEGEFQVVVEDEALSSIKTVGDIVDYLEKHLQKA